VEPLSIWIIVGAYVIPSAIAIGTFILQARKDKRDIHHTTHQDDLDQGKLSLDIAKELRSENAELKQEIKILREENRLLNKRVQELETEVTSLRRSLENTRPKNGG